MDVLQICEDLKEKIVWLELEPDSTFNLVELARYYDVSRYPITIALTRLEVEGLVARKGSHFVVSPLSIDRIRDTVEIRLVLEVQANVWAMNRMNNSEASLLNQIRKEMVKLQANGNVSTKDFIKLDFKFHHTIFKVTKNNYLCQTLDRMLSQYLRYWLNIPYNTEPPLSFSSTFEIFDAIDKKNEAMLREASINHIKDSFMRIMEIS